MPGFHSKYLGVSLLSAGRWRGHAMRKNPFSAVHQVLVHILKCSFPTFSEPNTTGLDVEPDELIIG